MAGTKAGTIVQERDRHLLRELAVLRVIDRILAMLIARFGSTTRANTRLLALVRAGLLRRFFLGTTASGRKALYSLSKRGAELVGVPYRGLRRGSDETLVADVFVTHQLRINEILCTAKYRPVPIPDLRFAQWKTFHEPIDPSRSLIPDGYVEFRTPSKTLAAFVEVDLGNETRSVWRKKIQAYLAYAISGHFEREFGPPQFRTLVVAHSERRLSSLRAATAELTEKIFWLTTFESIAKQGFWSPIWRRPKDHQPQALIGKLQ